MVKKRRNYKKVMSLVIILVLVFSFMGYFASTSDMLQTAFATGWHDLDIQCSQVSVCKNALNNKGIVDSELPELRCSSNRCQAYYKEVKKVGEI